MIENLSETVGYSHNLDTYNYVRINAPVLQEAFLNHEFTRAEYDRKLGKWDYSSSEPSFYHKGLSLDTARKWGFVEVVKEEPLATKMETFYVTTDGQRICSIDQFNKMDEGVIKAIKAFYGDNFKLKTAATPVGIMKRYYYKWNEDNYQKWLEESRKTINRKIQGQIALKTLELEALKSAML